MAIKLYDTLLRKKKELNPRSDKKIGVFVCGPTVYDYSHLGHARTYIAFDAFIKYLRHKGYEVRYVQNITDIEDKIIARARELNQPPKVLARNFETEYYHDMENLGVDSVDKYARATDYIPQIISQVERLMAAGYAYEIEDEGIYFDISKFRDYGKLSRRTVEQAEDAVSRIDESIKKRNKGDFALWKHAKADEPKWPSPWGEGRPGWHIEDTAVTETELGTQYDIHGGGRDLTFPHHESEIAQMEAISAKEPLVNYWMHTGFLTVDGEKMSKSLGNFITIHEFLREHSKEALRLLVLSSHYRSPIDYTEKAVEQADANVRRIGEFKDKIAKLTSPPLPLSFVRRGGVGGGEVVSSKSVEKYIKNFYSELADDFNTPKAFAVLFELVREGNSRIAENKINPEGAEKILEFLQDVNKLFGIIQDPKTEPAPAEITELADQREKFRREGNWEEADKVREQIEASGYTIDDTPSGPKIRHK